MQLCEHVFNQCMHHRLRLDVHQLSDPYWLQHHSHTWLSQCLLGHVRYPFCLSIDLVISIQDMNVWKQFVRLVQVYNRNAYINDEVTGKDIGSEKSLYM